MIHTGILSVVGNTPLLRLSRIPGTEQADILVKLELMNVSGSAKIRSAKMMIEDAEQHGLLTPGDLIVEASSGNGGIAMAAVGAAKGYPVVIVMPDNASIERQQLIRAYGARVVLTPAAEKVSGAIAKAKAICAENPGSFYPDSMRNPVNPESHSLHTAQEIVAQTDRPIHAFLAGAGSGGTLCGIAQGLRSAYPDIRIFAVSPAFVPTLVAGVGAYNRDSSFPLVFDSTLIEDFVPIPDSESKHYTRLLAEKEGILAGPSSGMVVAAAIRLAAKLGPGHTIATVLMDTGERYLSTGLFSDS